MKNLNGQFIVTEKMMAKSIETLNREELQAKLRTHGFTRFHTVELDAHSADFIAFSDKATLGVQLKGRLTISKKYLNKGLVMGFPINGEWYIVDANELVDIIAKISPNTLITKSWIDTETYSWGKPNKKIITALQSYKI